MATDLQRALRHGGSFIRAGDAFSIAVGAQANTDFTFQLPAGARNVKFSTSTTTPFGATTDAQIQIGKTAGGAEYVAAVSAKAQGRIDHAHVASAAGGDLETVPGAPGSMTTFTARLVQTGTPSAVGQATLFAEYWLPV